MTQREKIRDAARYAYEALSALKDEVVEGPGDKPADDSLTETSLAFLGGRVSSLGRLINGVLEDVEQLP